MKVKRCTPVWGSRPIIPMSQPKQPTMRPCTSILPANAEIRVMPMMASQKNSIGLNDKTNGSTTGRISARQTTPIRPPIPAAARDAPRARPACPARTMG